MTNQTHILGCKLDLMTNAQIDEVLATWLNSRFEKVHHIVTLNPEISRLATKDEKYRALLNAADLTVADGIGLKFGAGILGSGMPKRITGRQIVDKLLRLDQAKDLRVYLLGAKAQVVAKAAQFIKNQYPDVQIVGAEEGMEARSFTYDNIDLVNRINKARPDILLVAFGAPKQEKWIALNAPYLDTVKVAIGVGGLFDYWSDNCPSPGLIWQKLGLEWLFRLLTQKNRLRRIIHALISFPLICLKWRFLMTFVYRHNVLGVIVNDNEEVLLVTPAWSADNKWQFPQGGVDPGESPQQAILREMKEELGTSKLVILRSYPNVYKYDWSKWYQLLRGYKGQKQDIYFLKFTGDDINIRLNKEELTDYQWIDKNQLLNELAPVRKEIGQIVVNLFDEQAKNQ